MDGACLTDEETKEDASYRDGRKEGVARFAAISAVSFGQVWIPRVFSRESLCDLRNEQRSFVLYVLTQGTMPPSLVSLSLASAEAAKKGGIGSRDPSWLSNTKA